MLDAVEWWRCTTPFEGFGGQPIGPPEWPFPGGMLNQPNEVVEAAMVLRQEWGHIDRGEKRAPERK